jgi:hypothetical protein
MYELISGAALKSSAPVLEPILLYGVMLSVKEVQRFTLPLRLWRVWGTPDMLRDASRWRPLCLKS